MITSISLRWFMLAVQVSLIVGLESGPRPAWSVFVLSVYIVAAAYLWRLIGGKWREPERLARIMRE
jgi:MATE family multidrug resistance protein